MKCQILFSRKNKNNIISLSFAEIGHSMISVNPDQRGRLAFVSVQFDQDHHSWVV